MSSFKWQRYAFFACMALMSSGGLSLAHLAGPGGEYQAMLMSMVLWVLAVVAGRETVKWMQRYDARHGLGHRAGANAGSPATSPGSAGWRVAGGAALGSALGLGLWQAAGPSVIGFTLASLVLAFVGGMALGPEATHASRPAHR